MTEHYYNVAVVGATGAVGQMILKLLKGHQRGLNMWIVSDIF
jgi:aspartate-semialdehyde dehydrogenase